VKSLVILAVLATLALPLDAEIRFRTQAYSNPSENPAPTQANMNLINQAIRSLANDQRLANHPIRWYLNDPNLLATIVFDNPALRNFEVAAIISPPGNDVLMRSGETLGYYLRYLAHEFVHIEMQEKYGVAAWHSFLSPEDYAFNFLMEEAFAMAIDYWTHLAFPEIPKDPNIRIWQQQNTFITITEAMYNDFKAQNPNMNASQINARVATEKFHMIFTRASGYATKTIPDRMALNYGERNTFLILEYGAYRANADALLRHRWNFLVSLMPFTLPANYTYDYFRNRFRADVIEWAKYAPSPEQSILYWLNYDHVGNARRKAAALTDWDRIYQYLPREDEVKLNRVMREINPYFTPINTGDTEWRQWQERQHGRYR